VTVTGTHWVGDESSFSKDPGPAPSCWGFGFSEEVVFVFLTPAEAFLAYILARTVHHRGASFFTVVDLGKGELSPRPAANY